MDKKLITEQSHQVFHLLRTLTFLGEYKLLDSFTKLFRPWVEVPPRPQKTPETRDFLLKDMEQLFKRDAELFGDGVLSLKALRPESPIEHSKRLARILWTGVKMSRQRKIRQSKPSQKNHSGLPEYFTRNFHWQIDGYLSAESAAIYDHQVEILFTGTASAMRRLAIRPLEQFLKTFVGQAKLLEIAAGTGEISHTIARAFPQHQLTVTDISRPYLNLARQRMQDTHAKFEVAMAEKLPFEDQSQDVVYSIYLFHELPSEIRHDALKEMWRVLTPGGRMILVDSIQKDEVPEYAWALERFPRDYHEPFYKSYTEWNLPEALEQTGFREIHSQRGFFSKCVWATKPF